MTGREIFSKITSSDFYAKALDFSIQKVLVFESEQEASEFLSLYCTLLAEKKYGDFNEERLSSNYKKFTVLLQKKKISTKDFLEKNSRKEAVYLLQGNMCRVLHIL